MKLQSKLLVSLFIAALPLGAFAQTAVTVPTAMRGQHEFTLGGSGASNTEFDDSFGGVAFSYGTYLNDTQEVVLRQNINYSNSSAPGSRQQWNGATRIAFDQHFAAYGALRPFIGANIGGAYGDSIRDTWAAGLEVGGKYYVKQATFVYATVEYDWFFRHARNLSDRFSDGQYNWSAGVGFNF